MGDTVLVTVDGVPLDPRLDLSHRSPSGFEWGYVSDGPAQLALALLADCRGNEDQAIAWYRDYHRAVVAGLPDNGWTLTEDDIRNMVEAMENN